MICAVCACGEVVNAVDELAGKAVRCRKCGQPVRIPDVARDDDDSGEHVSINVTQASKTNSLGVVAVVMGACALPFAWVPFCGFLGWPMAGLGLILGLCGLIVASNDRAMSKGSAVAGIVVSGLAIAISILFTCLATEAIRQASRTREGSEIPTPNLEEARPSAATPKEPAPIPEDKEARLRHEIFLEACAAEDRSLWEADRLFGRGQGTAKASYSASAFEHYKAELAKRRGLSVEELEDIQLDASRGKERVPEFPSCDLVAAAKALGIKVPVDREAKTYHRSICPVVGSGGLPTIPLDQVVADPALKPCPQCEP